MADLFYHMISYISNMLKYPRNRKSRNSFIHHFPYLLLPELKVVVSAGAYSSCHRVKAMYILDTSSVHRTAIAIMISVVNRVI